MATEHSEDFNLDNLNIPGSTSVSLHPTLDTDSPEFILWAAIKRRAQDLSFNRFQTFVESLFTSGNGISTDQLQSINDLNRRRSLPFTGTDAYRNLKVAAEAFLMVQSTFDLTLEDIDEFFSTFNFPQGALHADTIEEWKNLFLVRDTSPVALIPYLSIIRGKYPDSPLIRELQILNGRVYDSQMDKIYGMLVQRLQNPIFIELIWSYWHEESMLVQGLNAICRRFQNIKAPGARDPLANLEMDPLRPLNNIIWGYIQDEQHRLTVRRRAYEYDHHYGISLQGTAVGKLTPVDSRSRFIEAFHTLLNLCSQFYKQADDMTIRPDGFPLLNALKEVHLILTEGAHNQYGDLPSISRVEMLMMQWILARPELREFLAGRPMVAYPEPWMDRVATMNTLQGWTDTSTLHFRNLGVFGEELLLSVRFMDWLDVNAGDIASNWARFWRSEVQGYIHAYRAATGIDLSVTTTGKIDAVQPSVHLFRRWKAQRKNKVA